MAERPDCSLNIDQKPPILGSWRNLYLMVIGVLIFLIVFFYLVTLYLE